MIARFSLVAAVAQIVSSLATGVLVATDIDDGTTLTTRNCNNYFKGWEHDRFQLEYYDEAYNIFSVPYEHTFKGYVGVYSTTIVLKCSGCRPPQATSLALTLWEESKSHHCSDSEIEINDTECKCSLDYSF